MRSMAPRALADSRLAAVVRFHQYGYARHARRRSIVRDGDERPGVARRDARAGRQRRSPKRSCSTSAPPAPRRCSSRSSRCPAKRTPPTTPSAALVNVESDKRRVLYIEGEPRWEYKFIRRAEEDDRIVQLVSMLRTTENKIYRQGIQDPKELAEGFPTRAENLFAYQALVIGSVEATYFTPAQRELIREFVDRRGGGLLLLGGRFSLADGGWGVSNLADLLPVVLPDAEGHVSRRSGDRGARAGRRGQLHHAAGRRSGGERRALEEAART